MARSTRLLAAAASLLAGLGAATALAAAETAAAPAAGGLAAEFTSTWMPFLGRFHPVVLHLPIGLFFGLMCVEFLLLFRRHQNMVGAAVLLATLNWVTSAIAAAFGWFLYAAEGGYSGKDITWHLYSGFAVVGVSLLAWIWRLISTDEERGGRRFVYRVLLLANAVVLAIAGHHGGNITHGSTFLTEHIPPGLRSTLEKARLLEPLPVKPAAPTNATAEVTFHAAVIQPLFEARCVSCHGESKQKGDYRLDTPEHMMKAGESEEAPIVAGKPADSYLVKLIKLPEDDADTMPPEGKPRFTAEQIALIEWWVGEGNASFDLKMTDAKIPENLRAAAAAAGTLKAEGKKPAEPKAEAKTEPAPAPAPAAPEPTLDQLSEPLRKLGAVVQPIAQNAHGLAVEFNLLGEAVGDAQLALLDPLKGRVEVLNLGATRVTDAGLAQLSGLTALRKLYLDRTGVGDEGVARLAGLANLEYLNLYGSKVSDQVVPHLGKLPKLRNVFLWQTAVTTNGVHALRAALPAAQVDDGWGPEDDAKPAPAAETAPATPATPAEPKADSSPAP